MARILIGNIKGPKGDTGIQGPQGPEGPQGPQGPLPPLANNGLTTEPGFALDARYGKTLKDQLDTTNSNLNNKANKSELNTKVTGILDALSNVTFGRTNDRVYIRFTVSPTTFYQLEVYDDGPLVFARSIDGAWAVMWTK